MCSYKKRFKDLRIGAHFSIRGEPGAVYLKTKRKDVWFMHSVNAISVRHPKQGFRGVETFFHPEHLVKPVACPAQYKMVLFREVLPGQRFRIDPDLYPNLRKLVKSRFGVRGGVVNAVSSNGIDYSCQPDCPCYVEAVR